MKILIVTDAYYPQVNGVVRTLHQTGEILKSQGHTIEYITPQQFLTVPMPKYKNKLDEKDPTCTEQNRSLVNLISDFR